MTFNDLLVIKKCLNEKLSAFDGSVADKQEMDSAYLAIVDIISKAKIQCSSSDLELDDIKNVEVSTSFSLDAVIMEKMNQENLTLDF